MTLDINLTEGPMPTELGFYVCKHGEVKSFVEIVLHPQDNVPVITQFGTPRTFTQYKEDKGFFWSERIEL